MKKIVFHLLFLVIVFGDLTGEFLHIKWLVYTFKPLIMLSITSYFLLHAKTIHKKVVQLAVLAFGFSWLGDILLMFGDDTFIFFILGLVAFLSAQIFYIFLFLQTIKLSGKTSFFKKKPYWLLLYIIYGLTIYILLFNHLDMVLRVAVFVYMLALLGMSSMALNRLGNGHPLSFSFVFAGSVLFVLSDSMIAINKFLVVLPYEGILIMTTYIAAQYLIMLGILKQYE